jgi:predicted amidohydrolase
LVVFPELSLTGYDLDAPALSPDHDAFSVIAEACAATGSTALVGAPAREDRGRSIATFLVTDAGAAIAYRKMFPGGDEETVFEAGKGPAAIEVAGWRVGLGICKDTRIMEHIDPTLALGIDLYVAGLVHHPHELDEQDARALRIAARGRIPVAFASAAGNVGRDYQATAGTSSIWASDGTVLARATDRAGDIAQAVLGG